MVSSSIDYAKLYREITGNSYESKHHPIFPSHIRMIIAGTSGSGKTKLMIDFIMGGFVHFDDIMIYTTTQNQDTYEYLKLDHEAYKKKYKSSKDVITFHSSDDGIVSPSELDKNKTHIVIFDDVMNEENQAVMTEYFCRGRHNNANVFYLCESVHQLKKHGIRQNANIFILFKQDVKTLKFFHETHIIGDMPFDEFTKICYDAWSKRHGYIVINLWEDLCVRYILNYDTMYVPNICLTNVPNNT